MTTYKGTVKTAVDAGGLSNAMLQGLIDGRVKCNLETYTILGSELSGSVIKVADLIPAGANIIAILLTVSVAQSAATFSVGDANSATRYASASTLLQTAGIYVIPGKNYVVGTVATDNQILLTTGGATLTGATLDVAILYSHD